MTAPRDEDLLSRLVIEARQDLQRRRALLAQDQLERSLAMYTPKDFAGALRRPGLAVIGGNASGGLGPGGTRLVTEGRVVSDGAAGVLVG